jgi:hypothetical protein
LTLIPILLVLLKLYQVELELTKFLKVTHWSLLAVAGEGP